MSVMSQIKKIVYVLLETNGTCTLEEIKEYVQRQQIEIPPNSTIIRSTMYQLVKKDPRIRRIARGKYQFISKIDTTGEDDITKSESVNNDDDTNIDEDDVLKNLDKIEVELVAVLDKLEKFKWFQSDDEEVKRVRRYGERLKKMYDNISNRIARLSL